MITALLTTYCDEKFLPNSIKSILLQSFKNFELLIIDDGSTDETFKIVSEFNDPRIRYIRIEHCGRSAALNYGLRVAKFDWVFLIDADDLILPDTFKKYSVFIYNQPNIVVSCYASFHNGRRISFCLNHPTEDGDIKKFLYLHSINNTVLYNRNFILHELGGYSTSLTASEEDYELWLRAFNQLSFFIIPEYLVIKAFHRDSFSMKAPSVKKGKVYLLQKKFYDKMNLSTASVGYEFLGWRELFYGNKKKARHIFYKSGYKILKKPKVLLAILISYLPPRYFEGILLYNYYPRILYRLKYFSNKYKKIRNYYEESHNN